jgi:hypothetical protein
MADRANPHSEDNRTIGERIRGFAWSMRQYVRRVARLLRYWLDIAAANGDPSRWAERVTKLIKDSNKEMPQPDALFTLHLEPWFVRANAEISKAYKVDPRVSLDKDLGTNLHITGWRLSRRIWARMVLAAHGSPHTLSPTLTVGPSDWLRLAWHLVWGLSAEDTE